MGKRRGHGDGSLFWDESRGRWIGVVDLGREANGRRRRCKVSGRTHAEARRKLREAQARVTSGLPVGDQRTTLDEFLSRWLANSLSVKSLNTRANLEWAAGRIVAGLGVRRLRDLSADDVEGFLNAEAAAGLSRSSLVRIHSTLKRALRHAERVGKVARNVAALVDTPDGPMSEARSLTVEQARRLLDAARGDRLEPLYMAGLMIGPRPGELLGLTWADVDLDRGVIYIVRALIRTPDSRLALSQPKTPRSRRTVDLPAPLVAALRAHKTRQATERLAAGKAWQDNGLVFTTTVGTPVDPSNLRRAFSRLTKKAGLGHWHPHELRHSAASILSAAGVPLEEIADVLGHAGPRTTGMVYRHLITPSVRSAREPMERLFGAL